MHSLLKISNFFVWPLNSRRFYHNLWQFLWNFYRFSIITLVEFRLFSMKLNCISSPIPLIRFFLEEPNTGNKYKTMRSHLDIHNTNYLGYWLCPSKHWLRRTPCFSNNPSFNTIIIMNKTNETITWLFLFRSFLFAFT